MNTKKALAHSVRFAYIGCGFVGQKIHIPNFASLPDCDFIAIAEPRGDLGERVAGRYGIRKVYKSHEEIAADPEIEAVGVSAPYTLQGKIAHDLLRAGKHVFMEKPMAVSVKRAEAILETERGSSGRLMVGYMKRYDSGNILIKKHIDEWSAVGEQVVLLREHGFGGQSGFTRPTRMSRLKIQMCRRRPPPRTNFPSGFRKNGAGLTSNISSSGHTT